MPRWMVATIALLLVLGLSPATAGRERAAQVERLFDEHGRLLVEVGVERTDERVGYARHHHWTPLAAKGVQGGGGGADLTDCGSDAYRATGWRWRAPYSAYATAYVDEVAASLATWDAATSASLAGAVQPGAMGVAGALDGVNQLDWVDLGEGGTIAITTTWYDRFTGEAIESDGQYNTRYAWNVTGSPDAMDVQDIATHEIGHTLGLDHPRGKGTGCLTMYAYGSLGETQKRTLGDGDILGIRALYGA